MKIMKLLRGAAAVALLAPLSQAARADLSDIMSVTSQGTVLEKVSTTESLEAAIPLNVWKMDDGIANVGAYGAPTVLYEADGSISDIFGVGLDTGSSHYYLAFMSDAEGQSTAPGSAWYNQAVLWFGPSSGWLSGGIEGGTGVNDVNGVLGNATKYISASFQNAGAIATFSSDVPEPTTLIAGAMLLLPFGASTLRILRKNRAA